MTNLERHAALVLAGVLASFAVLAALILFANDALRRWSARRSEHTRALGRPAHPRSLRWLAGVSRNLHKILPVTWGAAALSFVFHMGYFAHLHYPDDRLAPTEARTVRSLENHGRAAYLTPREAQLYATSEVLFFFVFGPAAMVLSITAGWLGDFLKMEGAGEDRDG